MEHYGKSSLCPSKYYGHGARDTGYPHDGRADNAAYPHDRHADNAAYPHNRHI